MQALGLALAALVGLSLGLLGGGGSILTVPIFVYVLGFAAKPAIAMSLPVVGVTSLAGAVSHYRAGNVRLGTALVFGVIAMVGAYAGARLSALVSGTFQLLLLAVVMLAAAVSMFRRAGGDSRAEPAEPGMGAAQLALTALVGLAVGVLTGMVGIGGGFLFVPALVLLRKLPMKQAVGTSLVVIAMNAAAGSLGYHGQVDVPWGFTAAFAAVAIGGILLGTYLVRFVSQAALKRAFAVFLVVIGALMLYQNREAVRGIRSTGAEQGSPAQAH